MESKSDQVLIRRRTGAGSRQEAEFIVLKDPQNQEQGHSGPLRRHGGWTAGRGGGGGWTGGFVQFL